MKKYFPVLFAVFMVIFALAAFIGKPNIEDLDVLVNVSAKRHVVVFEAYTAAT